MRLRYQFDTFRRMKVRLLCQRRCTLTRAVVIVLVVSVIACMVLIYDKDHPTVKREHVNPPPVSITSCSVNRIGQERVPNNHDSQGNIRIGKRILVIVESPYTRNSKSIVAALDSARFPFKIIADEKNLPTLTHLGKGRFGVIIFESVQLYRNLDYWNKQLIDKYCREYEVGVIFFMKPIEDNELQFETFLEFSLSVQYDLSIQNYKLNTESSVWRILRPGETIVEPSPHDSWAVFHVNSSTHQTLAVAEESSEYYEDSDDSASFNKNKTITVAVLDTGANDGIRRVFFGNDFSFWLHGPMLLDSISYLSFGKLELPLERIMQIDIDDIFVGAVGTRMKAVDVKALKDTQERLRERVEGFKFLLGFSGWYYKNGNDEEDLGDQMLLEMKDHFHWFPHMWRHEQPHKFSEEELMKNMKLNYQFAQDNKIPVSYNYAVAPHHSGVFPVHEPLYNAWKSVWDIKVTSTEEYPKLQPSWMRRGFTHKGMMVLPRQTCGLFTHTIFMDRYPGGRSKLDRSIHGGELFKYFLYNPLNIFMTHLSNYGNDRLALYTFESVIKFVQCWTNLELRQVSPIEMAIQYFDMFPEEKYPVWRNPCNFNRHLEIWSANKTCDKLPKFLVVGPQKTGTTALYTFLSMHPMVKSNNPSKETFEELQFFGGANYLKGIDWYMNYFPQPTNATTEFLFEKSANYFDNFRVPMRAHALLPNAKIVCILSSPAKRAYSWYQHMKAHQDDVAMNYSFYEIITASDTGPSQLRSLRNRCLSPGVYEHHLMNWLDYYSSRQVYIIDGDKLKSNPIEVMDALQKFLHIEPYFDYKKVLRFDEKKGFYCQVLSGDKTRCLGRSKGRQYDPMDAQSEEYLTQFYKKHNMALDKLLDRLNVVRPAWLEEELGESETKDQALD